MRLTKWTCESVAGEAEDENDGGLHVDGIVDVVGTGERVDIDWRVCDGAFISCRRAVCEDNVLRMQRTMGKAVACKL